MKKALAILLALIMCVSLLPLSVFAEELTTLTLEIDSVTAVTGSSAQVKIALKHNPGIASLKLSVAFDGCLTLMGVQYNTEMGGQTMNPSSNNSPVTLIWLNPFEDFDDDVTFATLSFNTPSNLSESYLAKISVSYDENDIYNLKEENVPCKAVDGGITIFAGVPGDINGDGTLNNKDLTRLFQYLANWDVTINQTALDVNGDGSVNNKDLTRLFQYLADWDVDIYYGQATQHKHDISSLAAKSATCTESGNIACYYCAGCGKYFSDSNCKEELLSDDVVIPAKGHTPVLDKAVAPTSTTTGLTEGSHCSVCNEVIVKQEIIPVIDGAKYSITYNISNGDSYLASQSINNPNPNYYSDSGLTLKNVSCPGYTFLGWYDLPAGSGAEIVKKISAGSTDDIELYAHWEKINYTVQFESDLIPVDDIHYTVDKGATLPVPQLDGYNFVGWSDGEGSILKTIPVGTTGNKIYTANWLSERNKAWTKNNLGKPIIVEDEETDTILFTYEIGRIENVPLYTIEDFGYINSEGVSREILKEYTVKTDETLMEQYVKNVSNATTNSSQWALSNGWSDSVSVNENYMKENNLSETDAKALCTDENNNWLVSSGKSGSTTTTKYDSSQDYDLNTATDNTKTFDTETGTTSHKDSSKLDLKVSAEIHAGTKFSGGSVSGEIGNQFGEEDSNSTASKTGTEHDAGSNAQKGSISHTGTDTSSSGGWNSSESYSESKTISESESTSKTISEKIASEYGYGKSFIKNGEESTSQGLSSTSSSSDTYSGSVTYSTEETIKESITYSTSNTKTGYHRLVKAGTAHVFAIVGYDIKTASFFVTTYSVMDDETHNFEDYSYSTALYDDNQTGVISFEVPFEVEEYVLSKVGETKGLEFDSNGIVTGYSGTESLVIIPEYHVIDNLDGTRKVVKVTGIASNAFKGNKEITGVCLNDIIETIPDNAFDGCSSLSLVDMANVTSIGKEAFKDCTQIDEITISKKVTYLGENAFENIKTFILFVSNKNVIDAAVNSGADNIMIYISEFCDLSDTEITVDSSTELFVFNGRGKTFNNVFIDSSALKTIINNATFNSSKKTALTISSEEVKLGQINVNASGIAVVLTNENCNLGLYGESKFKSNIGKAVLCKNVFISKTDDAIEKGVYSALEVDGDVLSCGTINGNAILDMNKKPIEIVSITEEEFYTYLKGIFTIIFDANGGTVGTTSKTVYCGTSIGELPVPTRSNYGFNGWSSTKNGGSIVNKDTIFNTALDVTLYAQWTPNAYKVTWWNPTGITTTVKRTSSPNADAATGSLSSGDTVYYGDVLSIKYSASTGYTISSNGSTSITVSGDVTSSNIYANATVNKYTVSWSTGTGYSITVKRTSSPKAGAATGTLSSGATVYYGDVLSVTYTKADYYTINTHGKTSITVSGNVSSSDIYATATLNSVSGWVSESSVPSGAKITDTKYTYTHRYYTQSTASSMSGWTKYDQTTKTSYGSWSAWGTSSISSSSTVDVQSGTVYRYYFYKCPSCGYRMPYNNVACKNCGTKSGYTWNCIWSDAKYSSSSYSNYDSSKCYTTSVGDGGRYYFSKGNVNATAVGTKDSTSTAVVITTGYRSRSISYSTTYYYYQDRSEESTTKPSGSDYSNITTMVKYRAK